MPDIEINCVQCAAAFLFTDKEQELFYQRNMVAPHRCQKCRPNRKIGLTKQNTEKHEIVCDRCGKKDRVPFLPKFGRSVQCRDCHGASQIVRRRVA